MQQKMMLFTPAVGVIYGLWFFLAPNSYWSVMTVPVDLISDLASTQLQNTGLALLVIAYVLIATRKYVNLGNISEKGITFWSSIYIPIVVAMAAKQNVIGALDGGLMALIAGIVVVSISFLFVPLISNFKNNK